MEKKIRCKAEWCRFSTQLNTILKPLSWLSLGYKRTDRCNIKHEFGKLNRINRKPEI